jgi:CRP/FNR family transcriptional regulator
MPPGHARAVAAAASSITEVSAEKLQNALRQRPDALMELTRQLAEKLQAAREESTSLIFDDCNSRLIQTLLRFSKSAAAAPHESGGVVLRITHQQLAQAVGAARETVSLALTQLRERNLLRTGRNQLFFNPCALEEFRKNGRPVEHAGKAA